MKKLLTGLVVLMGLTGMAQAADPQAGKELASGCVACHGKGGAAPIQGQYPKLSGLGETYLYRQLKAIQSGERKVAMMAGQLDGMSDQDLRDIAAYFDQQEMPRGEADPKLVDEGASLYRGGDMSKGVAACIACHGPQGKGNEPAGYPRVSGQNSGYVAQALKDYRSGARVYNQQSQIMGGIASKLSDSQIEAVAEYIEGLY